MISSPARTLIQTSQAPPGWLATQKIKHYLPDGWIYRHFTDADIFSFFRQFPHPAYPDIESKFLAIKAGAHKADLFRYYYLYLSGGAYLDSDVLLARSLGDITAESDFVTVVSTLFPGTAFNGFLYCSAPGNPIVRDALNHLYHCAPGDLEADYFYNCSFLFKLVSECPYSLRIRLYKEAWYTDKCVKIAGSDGSAALYHFWIEKKVPFSNRLYRLSFFLRVEAWSLLRHHLARLVSGPSQ